jgi:hypothetical protein
MTKYRDDGVPYVMQVCPLKAVHGQPSFLLRHHLSSCKQKIGNLDLYQAKVGTVPRSDAPMVEYEDS